MLALEDFLLMVLSHGNHNSLVRVDHTGALLNYMDTSQGQAFQDLESDRETVYAILSYEKRPDAPGGQAPNRTLQGGAGIQPALNTNQGTS